MKKIAFILLLIIASISLSSCTKNQRTRLVSGYQRIDLPDNRRLVNVQWQKSNLWVLTAKMDSTYTPNIFWFKEYSSLGCLEGEIVFYEHKK